MREILFRGKETKEGIWVSGDISFHKDGRPYIRQWIRLGLPNETYYVDEVDPETVGQYTGLNDNNGKRIFEGDLVAVNLPATVAQPEFSWGVCKVIFAEGCFGVLTRRGFIPFRNFAPRVEFEVAGNIFDKEENCNA